MKEKGRIAASPRSGESVASSVSAASSSSSVASRQIAPRRAGGKRKRVPRDKNGLGYNFFWGVLLFSLYWNVHFLLLRFSKQHPHHHMSQDHIALHHKASKDAFLNRGTSQQLKQAIQQEVDEPLPPVVPLNLTTELEALVSLESAEMLLKTAWQSLVQQTSKQSPYRIITNVVPRKRVKRKDYDADDFTLSTHATVGRLDRLLEQYIRWGGPASAAVHLSSMIEIDVFLAFIHDKGRILKDIAIHVLLQDLSFKSEQQYPSSILRNLAISQLETDYFVALDVDYVTNVNAHPQIRDLYTAFPNLTETVKNKTFLVMPAFASTTSDKDSTINAPNINGRNKGAPSETAAPRDKKELQQKYDQGLVEPLDLRQVPSKHGPTQFPIWLEDKTMGPFYPITYEPQFEPVVVAYRHGLPRYWTGYRGHFYNKSSWFAEAHRLGFKFAVLCDFFVVYDRSTKPSGKAPVLKSREWQKFVEYRERIHRGNVTQNQGS